jgi:23S rRNA pseudouridine955/2504/2580 synthase
MKEFVINKNDAGQRLDKFIHKVSNNLPYSLLYKAIRTKNVKLNGKRCTPEIFVQEGDIVKIFLDDDFFSKRKEFKIMEFGDLMIAYEDENVIIVDKPDKMLSHGEGSILEKVQSYLIEKGEYDPQSEQSFAPALCNRIDYSTMGLVIIAKNAFALRELDKAIAERRVCKRYRCKIKNALPDAKGSITCYLKKDEKTNKVTVSKEMKPGYKEAVTNYRRLGGNEVEIELVTGRTHQIRASLSYIGCPIIGDTKYGGGKPPLKLCSYSIIFNCKAPMDYLNRVKLIKTSLWQ